MFNAAEIKQLKQVNVSRDAAKTKSRIREVYEPAKRAEKQAVIDYSGQNRNSVYRSERTGNASAKIIVPLAQVCNVSPYWLAGMTDDKGVCTEEVMAGFLKELGYAKWLAARSGAPTAAVKASAKPKTAKVAPKKAAKAASKPGPKPKAATAAKPGPKPKAVTADKPAPKAKAVSKASNAALLTISISNAPQIRKAAENLDLESAQQLLSALYLRAKVGGEAKDLCETVKCCLLL